MPSNRDLVFSGKYIVFEGPDGNGKSTQVRLLKDGLKKMKFRCFVTKEPTEWSLFGQLVRDIYVATPEETHQMLYLFRHGTPLAEFRYALLFKNRLQSYINQFIEKIEIYLDGDKNSLKYDLLTEIIQRAITFDRLLHMMYSVTPALSQGKVVISDRNFLSTLVYGRNVESYYEMQKGVLENWFLKPDITFILSVSLKEGMRRIRNRYAEKLDLFEIEEIQKDVHTRYQTLSNTASMKALDIGKEVVSLDGNKEYDETAEEVFKTLLNLKVFGDALQNL